MSWDWDKLQENRKRQRGGGGPRNDSPENHSEESHEEFQRERKKFSSPNHGGGGDDPFGTSYDDACMAVANGEAAMINNGFSPLSTEWWHFTLNNDPYPNTFFNFPVSASSLQ